MSEIFIGDYKSEARKALENKVLQGALADLQNRFGRGTALAYQNLPEGPDLRLKAHEIRAKAIANLDVLLETLAHLHLRRFEFRTAPPRSGRLVLSVILQARRADDSKVATIALDSADLAVAAY